MSGDDMDQDSGSTPTAPARPGRPVWPGRLVRLGSGAAVLLLAGAVVVAGTRWPAGAADAPVPAAQVSVPPADTTLVCPGPLVLPEGAGRGGDFDPVPVDPVTSVAVVASATGGGTVADLDAVGPDGARSDGARSDGARKTELAAGASRLRLSDVTAAQVVRARPTDVPARIAATSSSVVTAGDLRGLAAASCQQPVADAWLVGGATDLSSSAHLVLSNPGSTPAEVDLEAWGPSGPVDLPAERHLLAPGAQKTVQLGAVAVEQRRLVVHVTSTGGRVAAYVQDSTLDGFTPTGTDLVVPGVPPARRQVVPGVSVPTTEIDSPDAAALRLLVPGDAPATARLTLLGPDGPVTLPGAETVDLAAGAVTDVTLGGLPGGAYTAVVDASVPVAAAVVIARPGKASELDDTPVRERAWAASTAVGLGGAVAVPAGARGTLVVSAVGKDVPDTGDATADTGVAADDEGQGSGRVATGTLRLLGGDGQVLAERTVRVPEGSTGAWRLEDLAGGDGTVTAGDPAAPEGAAVDGVVGADLVPDDTDGVALVWALVAGVSRPDGAFVSVVDPVPAQTTVPDVTVRSDPRLGVR